MGSDLLCSGRGTSCTCALCLVLERVLATCYRPNRTAGFRCEALARLRTLQAELLDLAELEDRALLVPSAGAPHPGTSATPTDGGKPVGRAGETKKEEVEHPQKEEAKSSRASRSRKRRRRRETPVSGSGADRKKRSPSYSRKRKAEENRGTEEPKEEEERRERSASRTEESSDRSSRDHRRRRKGKDYKEGKVKEELSKEEKEKEPVEDAGSAGVLRATSRARPEPPRREDSPEEADRGRSTSLQRRRPRSPIGPPPGRQARVWKGPIIAGAHREAPRWGKNRGKKKYARNEDVRRLGWHNFHASKRGQAPPRR